MREQITVDAGEYHRLRALESMMKSHAKLGAKPELPPDLDLGKVAFLGYRASRDSDPAESETTWAKLGNVAQNDWRVCAIAILNAVVPAEEANAAQAS